jgi:hypothetical protein
VAAGRGDPLGGAAGGVDRKTVRPYVEAACGCGLDRAGGWGQLGDELLGGVAERVRPHRGDRHGESWALVAAPQARLAEPRDQGVTVVKNGEMLAREDVVVPERTLHRYALEVLGHGRAATARVADCEPGAECQADFGKMGLLPVPPGERRRAVHALRIIAAFGLCLAVLWTANGNWPTRNQCRVLDG